MKKIYLFVALLASWAAVGVQAQQQKVFVVNGDTLSEYDHVCLPHDGSSTITVKFVRENLANKSNQFSYYWMTLGDLEKVGEGTITTDMQAVRVRPNGLEGCDGEYSEDKTLVFRPAAPEGIEADRCIAAGIQDTTTLTLSGVIQNQSYDWILPNGVTYVTGNANKTEIKVATAGIAGDYVVKAYGAGQGICGNTDTISETLHIASVQFSIKSETGRRYINVFTDPEVLEDVITDSPIVYYEWFLNDSLADEAVDAYETNVHKSFTGTIRLVVTLGNGCKQSATMNINDSSTRSSSKAFSSTRETTDSDFGHIIISPNPSSSILNVTFPTEAERSVVRIYDMNGKLVFRKVTSEKQLDITTTHFPSGMYTLLLNQDGDPCSATFIVQH